MEKRKSEINYEEILNNKLTLIENLADHATNNTGNRLELTLTDGIFLIKEYYENETISREITLNSELKFKNAYIFASLIYFILVSKNGTVSIYDLPRKIAKEIDRYLDTWTNDSYVSRLLKSMVSKYNTLYRTDIGSDVQLKGNIVILKGEQSTMIQDSSFLLPSEDITIKQIR